MSKLMPESTDNWVVMPEALEERTIPEYSPSDDVISPKESIPVKDNFSLH